LRIKYKTRIDTPFIMKQIQRTLNILLLVLLIAHSGFGQVKKTMPPKKPGPPKKVVTIEDQFKTYLQTENEALAGTIIHKDSLFYGLYCQAILVEEPEEKIVLFTKFIDLNPKVGLAKAYLNRGAAYVFSEKYQESLPDFGKAVSLDPKEKFSYYFRGIAYHSLGQQDSALKDLNQTIKMQPSFAMAYLMRGSTYIKMKNFKSALADLNVVVKSDPFNDQGYLFRGMAYEGLELYDQAIADWKEAKKLNKENSDTVHDLINRAKEESKGHKTE
jgi:tetratricopeptide (TPR) repeat protein